MGARNRTAKEKQGQADKQKINHSLMMSLYSANTLLWLVAPGFV